MTSTYKDVVMIGGPNGAGKTTAATTQLPKILDIREFVNADEIAGGLSPFNPEGSAIAAGRLMIERIHELIARGESFAFETTCSGRAHAQTLLKCRDAGYRLTLIFLASVSQGRAETCCKARCAGRTLDTRTLLFGVMLPG